MPSEILFISDLHLSATKPDLTRRFLRFTEQWTSEAERLYILGDLFDAYIGDDDDSTPNREVKAALKKLTDSGTAVYFQHGNRDFLVGERFARETGASLLGDWAVIDLFGASALVSHGDLLCTDDTLYQAARQKVRAEAWKHNALSKPLFVRQLYARWYRLKSGWDKSKKTQEIMDANPEAIIDALRQYGTDTLIHGHTHRPAVHQLEIDQTPAQRFVLADWDNSGHVLRWQGKYRWVIENFD